MSRLSNFGEQFSTKVLAKTYQNAIIDSIVNRNYEGEIKKPGDRVNILSFLNSMTMSDYVVGTDMVGEALIDSEDQLIVEKRKYWNFSLDRLEDQFSYADDIVDHISNDAAKTLEREIDAYVIDRGVAGVKAGNWVGVNVVVNGATQTHASITTTATGGTVTLQVYDGTYETSNVGTVENGLDGIIYFAGFEAADIGKGFRLRSTASFVTPWYRIASVTSSTVAAITE